MVLVPMRSNRQHQRRVLGLVWIAVWLLFGLFAVAGLQAAIPASAGAASFPPPLESYGDAQMTELWSVLKNRVEKQPFNLWATLLFLGSIIHTFLTHRFRHVAHVLEERHEARLRQTPEAGGRARPGQVCGWARFFHFLGEVEAVFGIWVIPLMLVMKVSLGTSVARTYLNGRVNFSEAVFVVVIMAVASTRPILQLAEQALRVLARLGGERPAAWWLAILTAGSLLGSFITEPAAMTICASLLSRKFYAFGPSRRLAYGTLGLLFVNISVGGTLTHFAAPPVLMVAAPWGWDTPHMLMHFGWKAALGVGLSAGAYYLWFRRELVSLSRGTSGPADVETWIAIPAWVTAVHVGFMILAVIFAHDTPYLFLGLLFFLAFVEVTEDFQRDFQLRSPVLVGFFLAGLVIHGGLQQWWIAPVLGRLNELPLMFGSVALTAFNDNAAITYLCTLVPTFTEGMKYVAVAGAVTGGGLTVIANAPNPAGQSILKRHFEGGIGAVGLLAGALVPTLIVGLCFALLR